MKIYAEHTFGRPVDLGRRNVRSSPIQSVRLVLISCGRPSGTVLLKSKKGGENSNLHLPPLKERGFRNQHLVLLKVIVSYGGDRKDTLILVRLRLGKSSLPAIRVWQDYLHFDLRELSKEEIPKVVSIFGRGTKDQQKITFLAPSITVKDSLENAVIVLMQVYGCQD